MPCPVNNATECDGETAPESIRVDDSNLAWLPMLAMDCRDAISERIYIGKAVLKERFFTE